MVCVTSDGVVSWMTNLLRESTVYYQPTALSKHQHTSSSIVPSRRVIRCLHTHQQTAGLREQNHDENRQQKQRITGECHLGMLTWCQARSAPVFRQRLAVMHALTAICVAFFPFSETLIDLILLYVHVDFCSTAYTWKSGQSVTWWQNPTPKMSPAKPWRHFGILPILASGKKARVNSFANI